MIVTCQRDGLLNACQIVAIAVPARTTMPVYQNIKAVAEGDCLTLMATDLEIGVRYELRGLNVEREGSCILPVSRLIGILRESNDKEVSIDADPKRILVETKTGRYELLADDPATFSDITDIEGQTYFELAAGDLQRMIRRSVFAAAKEEGKYAMRGVLWDADDKKAKLVATDGKRLAVCEGPCVKQGDGDTKGQSHLIPPKAMTLLERILSDGDSSQAVQVCPRSNDALFRTEKAVIYTRLVEGRFPPYREVIPKKANAKIALAAGEFYSAVRQAAIMVDDENKRMRFQFKAGKVTMQAQGATSGRSKVELMLPDFTGPDIEIEFDPMYLTDMLKVIDPGMAIQLDLIDGQKSALFRVGDDYLYMVVPLT
jgi:DNA polymerase III subunit beta